MISPLLEKLIASLRCLPGVGTKTAQRMAFHLLQSKQRTHAQLLAETLQQAITEIDYCDQCRIYCEQPLCEICANPQRILSICCIVESPADVLAIEQSGSYRGRYFVLHGHLSPIDSVGPEQLAIPQLIQQVQQQQIKELIFATNPTAEGEATAYYIQRLLSPSVDCSRIAHGVPIGGELEYLDHHTLQHAMTQRQRILPQITPGGELKRPNQLATAIHET